MSTSRRSHVFPGRTRRGPHDPMTLLLFFAVVAFFGCARVPSPQETTMPDATPAPPTAAQPAVVPVDTTEPPEPPRTEPLPVEPAPEPEPAEVPTPPLEARALTNVDWRLTDLGNTPVVTGEPADRDPYLQLSMDGTTVSGSTGCNTFSGPYTLMGDALHFGALVTTKVACTDPGLSDQEQRFLDALEAADRFEINGDVLILYAGMDPVARFEAARAP